MARSWHCRMGAVTANKKRQLARILGEFLREAGVLLAVLSPLESLVSHGTLTATGVIATLVIAGPCLYFGLWLGLERS